MKTTIYELLGMIKDGKAPKKIKYGNYIYKYDKELADYKNEDDMDLFDGAINTFMLNDEVEILDEPKEDKINKIEKGNCSPDFFENNAYYLAKYFDDIRDKINELIDEVNKLKEKK